MSSAFVDLDEDDRTGAINTGIIGTNGANRRVWLVKVPDYLAERLADIEEEGVDLGIVRAIPQTDNSPAQIKLFLSADGPCGDLPPDYTLQLGKCDQLMHVFCEDMAGRAVMIEGKVEQDCQLRPVMNERYREVIRKRNQLANKPKRSILLVESSAAEGMIPHVSEQDLLRNRRRRFEPEQRRDRLPREEVQDMLFRAFEQTPHWTFRGLLDYSHQPSAFLKEVLDTIAIYNKRGPYKNLYELRSEYKSNN